MHILAWRSRHLSPGCQRWPSSGFAVISWAIDIAAVLIGAFLIYLGSRFKRLKTEIQTLGYKSG